MALVALGLFAASTLMQLDSDRKEANAQKRAELANKEFFESQKKLAEQATRRALSIFEDESDMVIGDHISAYAKAGVDLSGSALTNIAALKASLGRERTAIESEGASNAILAGMRADQAGRVASEISSGRAAAIGGRIISGVAQAQSSGAFESSGDSSSSGDRGSFSRRAGT